MTYTIHIDRLALHGHHGVLPQESIVGAEFYVSLGADVDVAPEAYEADALEGTVCYAHVVDVIRQEMNVPAALLEHLAYRMGQRILRDFPSVKSLRLRIDKENPPCGARADAIGVSVSMTK